MFWVSNSLEPSCVPRWQHIFGKRWVGCLPKAYELDFSSVVTGGEGEGREMPPARHFRHLQYIIQGRER